MSLTDSILQGVGMVGDILDTPGAVVRTALAGENPLPAVFDTSRRKSGRDVLERMGVLGENQAGLDAGDVAGFGAEMLLDPMNLVGGGVFTKMLRKVGANKASNALRPAIQGRNLARDRAIVDAAQEGERLADLETLASKVHGPTPEGVKYVDPSKPNSFGNTLENQISRVDERDLFAPGKMPGGTGVMSPDDLLRISYGSHGDIADVIRRYTTEPGTSLTPVPVALDEMLQRTGTKAIPFGPLGLAHSRGFVVQSRPDIVFVRTEPYHRWQNVTFNPTGTAMHEATHSLQFKSPATTSRMNRAIGQDAASHLTSEYLERRGANLNDIERTRRMEPAAITIGNAFGESPSAIFAAQDYVSGRIPKEFATDALADKLRDMRPLIRGPRDLAGTIIDYLDKGHRINALVPSGSPHVGYSAPRNWRETLARVQERPMAAFSQSLGPYEKLPPLLSESRLPATATLASILGHNALSRYGAADNGIQ